MLVDLNYFSRDFSYWHGEDLCAAELQAYGVDHTEAGAQLLEFWELPDVVQMAAAHHQDVEFSDLACQICALADQFVHQYWNDVALVEDVQALMRTPPYEEVMEMLKAASLLDSSVSAA